MRDRKLKVALVDLNFDSSSGGQGATFVNLTRGLTTCCDVTIFASYVNPRDKVEGVRYIVVPSLRFYRFLLQFWTFRISWLILRKTTALRKFDIVCLGSPLFGGGDVAFVHFCSKEYLRLANQRQPQLDNIIGLATLLYKKFVHTIAAKLESRVYAEIAARRKPLLLPVSPSLAESLQRHFGIPAEILRVIPNPVDTTRFHPGFDLELWKEVSARTGWGEDSFRLLFVGGDWLRKGLDLVIRALAQLPREVKLLVVGPGNPQIFQSTLHHVGLAGRVLFAGHRRDVERFYRIAHAFVLPSRYEALPLVCLEALASGVPILVTQFPGTELFLEDGRNGFVISTEHDLAEKVRQLMRDRDTLGKLAENAVATANRFDREQVIGRLLQVFEEILRSKYSGDDLAEAL
jgi:UDP-glucose:(heptosyl)LPS alpha-1,3-glucosyltransferase